MKRTYLLFLFSSVVSLVAYPQDILTDRSLVTNETIHQISSSAASDILGFQMMNRQGSNFVFTQQIGDFNKANINQQNESGSLLSNQSYTLQQGNSNELTVGQIGSSNTLLSFQMGYLATETFREQGNHYGFGIGNGNGNANAYGHLQSSTYSMVVGERNKLIISQSGSNNGIMAIQLGTDNSISATQTGKNNYLAFLQNGKNNSVKGYSQTNNSDKVLFDTFIQIGENLSIDATDDSKSKPNGNKFTQTGVNLSLQVSNEFVNSLGGIEISQGGKDMKVTVDQSYFIFPMK